MAISPPRAFALGACSILVLAGVFVLGIGVGARSGPQVGAPTANDDGRITCTPSPGFRATRAATERAEDCETARMVQDFLLGTGVHRAWVQVTREPSAELLGPEYVQLVDVQVELGDSVRDTWDAKQAARAISGQVGTPLERVTIVDDDLKPLFDERRAAPGPPRSVDPPGLVRRPPR